jgi:hypothetical protein
MIDYKFNSIIRDGTQTTVNLTIYRGAITTEDEMVGLPPTPTPVIRYRRSQILGTYQRTLDRDVTEEQVRRAINQFLITRASQLGETVITEQSAV